MGQSGLQYDDRLDCHASVEQKQKALAEQSKALETSFGQMMKAMDSKYEEKVKAINEQHRKDNAEVDKN